MKSKWILVMGGLLMASTTLTACYGDDARPGRHRPHDRHDRDRDRDGHHHHDRHDRDWRQR